MTRRPISLIRKIFSTPTKAVMLVPRTANQMAEERTSLAARRTILAADRSLMAWIRTGLAMISFGITIYKLIGSLQEQGAAMPDMASPRNIGLLLTGFGTFSIVMGAIDYWHTLRELHLLEHIRIWRPALVLAFVVACTGIFLFMNILRPGL